MHIEQTEFAIGEVTLTLKYGKKSDLRLVTLRFTGAKIGVPSEEKEWARVG